MQFRIIYMCIILASLQKGQDSTKDYSLCLPEAYLDGKVRATSYSSA